MTGWLRLTLLGFSSIICVLGGKEGDVMDAVESAKKWIESLSGGAGGLYNHWRVSLLSKRYSKDGKERPLRIRRFAEGCPASCLKEALEHLLSLAPYTGVVFNGQPLEGEYRPTLTYWKRDLGETVNGQGRADATYTLVQDLVDADLVDAEGAGTGASCADYTTTEWHWDDAAPGDVPSTGDMQGRTYAVTGVSRNEDGTFNWSLVTRIAKTRVTEWTTVRDNLFETVETRTYDNLYGEPWEFRDQDGDDVYVPLASVDAGVTVQAETRIQDDCTWRVDLTRVTAKRGVEALEADELTQYERKTQVQTKAVDAPLGDAPEASGGVTKAHRSELRPDGLWDVTEGTDVERRVEDAEVEVRRTLRGVIETRVDRNVEDGSVDAPKLGDHVKVTKTPGRLYVREETHVAAEDVGTIAEACAKTIYEHEHAETSNEANQPDKEADNAGEGKVYEVSARATEEGTWDVVRKTTEEIAVSNSEVEKSKTLRGVIEKRVDRNVADGSTAVSKIGDRVRVTKTPGGRYVREVTSVSSDPVGTIAEACSNTETVHTHTTTENKTSYESPETRWSTNNLTEKRVAATEEGTWDITTKEETFNPVEKVVSKFDAEEASGETTQFFNRADLVEQTAEQNQSVSISAKANDHGTFDGEYTITTHKSRETTVTESWAPVESKTTYITHDTRDTLDVKFGTASSKPDGTGGYTTTVTIETPKEIDSGWITWDSKVLQKSGIYFYHHGFRLFRNLQECPKPDKGRNVSVRVDINKFGLYDGSISYEDLYEWEESTGDSGGGGGSTDIYVQLYQKDTVTGRLVKIEIQGILHGRYFYGTGNDGAYASALKKSISVPGAPSVGGRVVWKELLDSIP